MQTEVFLAPAAAAASCIMHLLFLADRALTVPTSGPTHLCLCTRRAMAATAEAIADGTITHHCSTRCANCSISRFCRSTSYACSSTSRQPRPWNMWNVKAANLTRALLLFPKGSFTSETGKSDAITRQSSILSLQELCMRCSTTCRHSVPEKGAAEQVLFSRYQRLCVPCLQALCQTRLSIAGHFRALQGPASLSPLRTLDYKAARPASLS